MTKIKQQILVLLLALLIANPTLVFAQSGTNSNANKSKATNANVNAAVQQAQDSTISGQIEYKGVQESIEAYLCTPSAEADGHDLTRCINKMYKFGIAFGAIALVFFVVLAGYFYIAGGEAGKGKAKGILQNAIVGLFLMIGSYVLLSFINPDLVIFKTIQAPIFDANLPTCEEIGFEDDCVVVGADGNRVTVKSGGGAKGNRVTCPGGKLVKASSLGLPSSGHEICEEFGKKLASAWASTKSTPWVITRTTTGKAESRCHKPGNAFTGTCADIDFTSPKDVKNVNSWNALCRAIKAVGLYPHNEVGHAKDGTVELRSQLTDCGGFNQQTFATGDHIHVMWFE